LAGEPAQAGHGGKAIAASWPVPVQRLQAGPAHDRAEHGGHDDGVRVVATPAELFEDPAVELVVVAAPNAAHHQLARWPWRRAATSWSKSRWCPGPQRPTS
jgi:predicted dehydrogenase